MFADTWRFDMQTNEWSQVGLTAGAQPSTRSGHSLVYDAARHRVLLFGGQQMSVDGGGELAITFLRDAWSLDCNRWAWSRLPDHGDAPQRNGHSAVVCAPSTAAGGEACMLVFGGSNAEGPQSSLWRYGLSGANAARWTQVQTRGEAPEARELHAACIVQMDGGEQLMLVSGGRGVGGLLNTFHALRIPADGGRWEWNLVGQCPPRAAHSMLPLNTSSGAPVLTAFTPPAPAAPATAAATADADIAASSVAAATAAASPASPPAFPSGSIPLLLFGGSDGSMFYNDVLSFALHPSALNSMARAPPPACPNCQGPPGWSMLVRPDNAEDKQQQQPNTADAEATAAAAAAAKTAPPTEAAAATDAAGEEKKKKRKKKRGDGGGVDVQPPVRFAHTLVALPYASPAFATPPAASAPASSATSSAAAPAISGSAAGADVPASFLLFGGLNDETDLDDTHYLSFGLFEH